MAYQEISLEHPKRRQIFAGKPYSTFWNIWDLLILKLGVSKPEIKFQEHKKGIRTDSFQNKRKPDMFSRQSCINIELDKNLQ